VTEVAASMLRARSKLAGFEASVRTLYLYLNKKHIALVGFLLLFFVSGAFKCFISLSLFCPPFSLSFKQMGEAELSSSYASSASAVSSAVNRHLWDDAAGAFRDNPKEPPCATLGLCPQVKPPDVTAAASVMKTSR